MEHHLSILVGYDVREPSGEGQASLLERYAAEEFGPLDPDFKGSAASLSSWIYWRKKDGALKVVGAYSNGEADDQNLLIIGKQVLDHIYRLHRPSAKFVPFEKIDAVVQEVREDLRTLGVTAEPRLHMRQFPL